jgi:hypothetical protein
MGTKPIGGLIGSGGLNGKSGGISGGADCVVSIVAPFEFILNFFHYGISDFTPKFTFFRLLR